MKAILKALAYTLLGWLGGCSIIGALVIVDNLIGHESNCNVVHAKKLECPNGFVREALPRFTEKDGSKQYACVSSSKAKENCVDELRVGESETISFGWPAQERE